MTGGMEVFRGVLVLRIVAAAQVPASPAQPQVHPAVTSGEAVLAALAIGTVRDDLVQMRAAYRHGQAFSAASTPSARCCRPKETSWILPLMKNVGVARTPLRFPPSMCSRMRCK